VDDPNNTPSALAERPSILPPEPPTQYQTIRKWSVVGNGRLMGTLCNGPGQADGKTIMTSPVVQVRPMGELRAPVAFTESGNAYCLGDPAPAFGLERAEHFIWHKLRAAVAPPHPDPGLQTTVMKMLA
jgi:hypothetical protein